MIAVTSAAANVCTIASGPIVFGEPLPDEPAALVLRIAAFMLVIAAATLNAAADPGGGTRGGARAAQRGTGTRSIENRPRTRSRTRTSRRRSGAASITTS